MSAPTPDIEVHLHDGPLPVRTPLVPAPGAGASVLFEGIVRPTETGDPIAALRYQAYEPMAQRQLRNIAEDVVQRFGLRRLHVHHSRGRVGVGECSFRLLVESPHRKEALAAMDEFIDRLKRDVPIWKSPVPADAPAAASD